MIRNVVASNRDIKVWNLSLGFRLEVKSNFISSEVTEQDRIQSEYDVIFVASRVDVSDEVTKKCEDGVSADFSNAPVVNVVYLGGESATYTRVDLVFFYKPDISYYGAECMEYTDKMTVRRDEIGVVYVSGAP